MPKFQPVFSFSLKVGNAVPNPEGNTKDQSCCPSNKYFSGNPLLFIHLVLPWSIQSYYNLYRNT